jgi:alpha-glucosidase
MAATPRAIAATVESPSKRVKIDLRADDTGRLRLSTTVGGKPALLDSAVGITVDGKDLGTTATLGEPSVKQIDDTYPTLGTHARATNRGVEAIFPVTVQGGPAWSLEVRAYDDGVAYRYRVPGEGSRKVGGESSEWKLPAGSRAWFQPHNNRKDYEAPWQSVANLSELPQRFVPKRPASGPGSDPASPPPAPGPVVLAAPALFQLPGDLGYAMLTEANLVDYTDTALRYAGDDTFRVILHNEKEGGFEWKGEVVSSWRTAVLAADLNWMVTGGPRLEHQQRWIDWTGALGFEYYLIDDGWKRWTKPEGGDNWAAMKDVVAYAESKNVKLWAWVDSKELLTDEARAAYFKKARDLGIVGLKIDFMKPANTEWVRWYDQTIRQAADNRLMLNFHGALKPTGRQRTLPNDLTREAVRGREMGKQPPLHDTILPFVRMVQGPSDYTPVDFRPDKLKGSSFAHELSQAIIFTSPFFCYGGAPENYMANESIDLLKTIPPTWDETRVLPGSKVGELAAYARRKGKDWYVGVMNGAEAPGFKIDLGFLGDGSYTIDRLADSPEKNDAFVRTKATVTAKDSVAVDLRKDGGFVARITPAAP